MMEQNQVIEIPPHTASLFKKIFNCLKPTEDITLAEWADKYRRLPSESSAEPGRWQTSRTPYLKKIMECLTDPVVREITMMSCVQVGKSEFLLNAMGYYAHIEPSTILMVQPTVDAGKKFSKERIATTIRDTPILRKIIGSERSRDSKNTLMQKLFSGGYIAIVGANAPSGLAARPIKIVLADEVDRWPESAKAEGDPLTIVEKRTATFPYTKKILKVSTPTIDGISRIQHEYAQGTMEKWKLPCPACGEYQELMWASVIFEHMIDRNIEKIDEDKGEPLCVCNACGELNNEIAWKSGTGEWFPDVENKTVKSFRLNALISPWMSWLEIVKEFWKSKDDSEMLKVFVNTVLGEAWLVDGDSINPNELYERRIKYNALVPTDVLILTAGVDVQDDRFEMEVVGWGENKVSWGIEYKVIYGNTALPEIWEQLDQHLHATYTCEDGVTMTIATTCIDSGGHRTTEVYRFCKEREARGVWAIKGKGGTGIGIVHTYSKTKKVQNHLFTIGVDMAKAVLFTRLSETAPDKAGYCYFPVDDRYKRNYDEKYFTGLTSEVKFVKMVRGRPKTEWRVKPGTRNEPLDIRVYNIAAIEILNPNFEEVKKRRIRKIAPAKRRYGTISKGVELE